MHGMIYSVPSPMALTQSYGHQIETTSLENLVKNNDEIAFVSFLAQVTQPLEWLKLDPMVQQGPRYHYLPLAINYVGFSLVPQMFGGKYGYETMDSQPPDLSWLPNLMAWFFLLRRLMFM
jgi:hypothetical protein